MQRSLQAQPAPFIFLYPLQVSQLQSGVGLLEALIALMIFSVGLLALAKLQIIGLRYSNDSLQRSIAQTQIQSIQERLRADIQQKAYEIAAWDAINRELLPQGHGSVTGNNPYKLRLTWHNPSGQLFCLQQEVQL